MADHVFTPRKTRAPQGSYRTVPPASSSTALPSTPSARTHYQQRTLTGRIIKPASVPTSSAHSLAKPLVPSPRTSAANTSRPAKRPKLVPSSSSAAASFTPPSSSSSSSPATPRAAKYGLCPKCRTGRRIRSRFKPHGRSPHAGKFRFVCSNRAVWDPESGQLVGCTYWEALEEDPLARAEEFRRQGQRPQQLERMGQLEGKKVRGCPRCGQGRLVEEERDWRRWWERVWVCRKGDGNWEGCGYRKVVGVGGDVQDGRDDGGGSGEGTATGAQRTEPNEFQGAVIFDRPAPVVDLTDLEEETVPHPCATVPSTTTWPERRPIRTPATPTREQANVVVIDDKEEPGITDYGDFGSEDERELVQLADQIMEELDEQEELELIEMADKVSAAVSQRDNLDENGSGSTKRANHVSASISLPQQSDIDEEEEEALELIELADRVAASLPQQGGLDEEQGPGLTRRMNHIPTTFSMPQQLCEDEEEHELELIKLTDRVSAFFLPAQKRRFDF
ncbi:hypothetical protein VTK26DRAFT_6878 [Humicola hyalothermophila]